MMLAVMLGVVDIKDDKVADVVTDMVNENG